MSEEAVYNEMVQIPENIGFEETLVGSLTKAQVAKLFLPAIVGIGVSYAFHLPTMLKFAVAGACILIGAVFAFIKPGGVSIERTFVNWFSYRARPRQVHDKEQSKSFVDVEEIYDSTAKMHGDLYVRVVEVGGCNFEFMSGAERANIIAGYEQFLNSIDGNVQISARPEKFCPKEYLQLVNDRLVEIEGRDARLKTALEDYMVFFEQFADGIIEHRFYAVVSVDLKRDAADAYENLETGEQMLEKANDILDIRAGTVIAGLGAMNLQGRQLEGGQLVELFGRYYGGGL